MKLDPLFVFDTNTLVSAVMIRTSKPRLAFDRAVECGKILLCTAVLDELNDVLHRQKLKPFLLPEEKNLLWRQLLGNSVFVDEITETITACRDPKDDKFLELAVSGRAACIITGDQDLLVLSPFRGIRILSPDAFLQTEYAPRPL